MSEPSPSRESYALFMTLVGRELTALARDTSFGEMLRHLLSDAPLSDEWQLQMPSREHPFMSLMTVADVIVEIETSLSIQQDIAIYLKRFPRKSLGLSRARFLHYHVGNYLNEVYLLKERLYRLTKIIEKMYALDPRVVAQLETLHELRKAVVEQFDPIIHQRGAHVHVSRYEGMDRTLANITLLEMLGLLGKPAPDDLFEDQVREFREKWTEQIKTNVGAAREFLDKYFVVLLPFVFEEDGSWRVPPT